MCRPRAKCNDRGTAELETKSLPVGLGVDVAGELSELPFDHAWEEIICPNDRGAILSRLAVREDRDNPPASPRAPVNLVLVAVDVAVLQCPPERP